MVSVKAVDSVGGQLSIKKHDRDASAMTYVYPVVSRRAGGVSIGVNLNVNNACNGACVYCQVPDLVRGGPPPVDIAVFGKELSALLDDVLLGGFLVQRVPEGMRRLADIAFSGNGEPTSSEDFPQAVDLVISELARRQLAGVLPIRVITNGSMLHRPLVQAALARLGQNGGEVWFKVDRATRVGMREVNRSETSVDLVRKHLMQAATLAPVWLQTCWFGVDGVAPSEEETRAYLEFVRDYRNAIRGVHLYGIARPSMQPDGARLTRLPVSDLTGLAVRLKEVGVTATISE